MKKQWTHKKRVFLFFSHTAFVNNCVQVLAYVCLGVSRSEVMDFFFLLRFFFSFFFYRTFFSWKKASCLCFVNLNDLKIN